MSGNSTGVQNRLQALAANVTKAMKAKEAENRANAEALRKASDKAVEEANAAIAAGQASIGKVGDVMKASIDSRSMSADAMVRNMQASAAVVSGLLSNAFTSSVAGKDYSSMDAMNDYQRSMFLANMSSSISPMDFHMSAYNQSLRKIDSDDGTTIAYGKQELQNKLGAMSEVMSKANLEVRDDAKVISQVQDEESDQLHQIDLIVGDVGIVVTDPVFKQTVIVDEIRNRTIARSDLTAINTTQATEFSNLLSRVDSLIKRVRGT
jgi:hypothetical protein